MSSIDPESTGAASSGRSGDRPAEAPPPPTDASRLRVRLEAATAALDRPEVVGLALGAVEAGLPLERLYAEVLVPLLTEVGHSWQRGRTAIWQEHAATQAVRTAVEALYPHVLARKAAVAPVRATVAFFCPPEEAHDLGLRMLCDLFDLRGFRTVFVGASTPVDEMVACASHEDAAAVCLSASTHYHRTVLHHIVSTLEDALPGVHIVVGGPTFAKGTEDLDGGRWAPNMVYDLEGFMTDLAASAKAGGVVTSEAAAGVDHTSGGEG